MALHTAGKRGPVATPEGKDAIRYAVCGYCRNRGQPVCLTRCSREGLYRHLGPVVLEDWDHPPEVPNMEELLAYDAVTRLALVQISLHYLRAGYIRVQPASTLGTDSCLEGRDRDTGYLGETNSC